jgi:hypothetical protein
MTSAAAERSKIFGPGDMYHPVWLKVVCIVSIALGALGLLMATLGIVGQLTMERTHESTLRLMESLQQGAPQPMMDLQKELQAESMAIQRQWLPLSLSLLVVNVFVAGVLLGGGIQALRMKPGGRKWLVAAMAAAAVFELVRLPPTAIMQWQTSKIVNSYINRILEATTPAGANVPPAQRQAMNKMTRSFMVAAVLFGMVTALSMAVAKIAFYVVGVWFLRRPHIQAMYSPAATAEVVD